MFARRAPTPAVTALTIGAVKRAYLVAVVVLALLGALGGTVAGRIRAGSIDGRTLVTVRG